MTPTIIRFPVAAKLGERPMATPVSLGTRIKRWLFGHERPKTWNSIKFERARKAR